MLLVGRQEGHPACKNRVVGCWCGCLSGARCRLAYGHCHYHSLSLASVKFRLVLPFWYRLTWVVTEKGPLNQCVCVCRHISIPQDSMVCYWMQDLAVSANGDGRNRSRNVQNLAKIMAFQQQFKLPCPPLSLHPSFPIPSHSSVVLLPFSHLLFPRSLPV